MTIKQHGGVFGRNPTFNSVEVESLSIAGNAVPDASTILVDGDIGSTVQGYDADTAKYDDATANFTGTLQNGGSNVLVDTDIGSTVQGYDADTAKLDAAQTFTAAQTFNENIVMANTKGIDFSATGDGSGTTDNELFDDYEEGAWTPVLTTTGTDFASVTYDPAVYGLYTKIGNVVHIQGAMRTDAVDTTGATGFPKIVGLPFAESSGAGFRDVPLAISRVQDFATNNPSSAAILEGNNCIFPYYRTTSNGIETILPLAAIGTGANNNIMYFSGTYTTA